MKRENILISEKYTTKRVSATKFTTGDIPVFDCSIHFGKEGNDVTMQNCNIEDNALVKCSPEDTYDFETGALIALMKMCGREKVIKACDELYKDDNYKNALQEMIENNEKLIEENKELHKNIDELFESEQHTISELGRLYFERHRLEEKVEKLKLDCEMLQHGYNDMIFCGGRQNGKQYTFLVDLFKKIDQKKVDTAYKEAYNTKLPVWQKEVLRQAYNIVTDEKEKRNNNEYKYLESFSVVRRNGEQINNLTVDSLIEKNRAFTRKCVDEQLYKIPTKREEMWAEIFAIHKKDDVIIKVKKEDINTFLHEIENRIPEITWNSCVKIFETKYTIGNIYGELKNRDTIYFRLSRINTLSYSSDQYIYPYRELKHIDYLPPMRWDLFEKGRKIVRVTPENIDDFIAKCTNNFGAIMKPNLKRYKDFIHTFIMISDFHYDNKPTIHIMSPEDLVRNQHENPKKYSDKKIVDWEDVR